jgi:uncharacterized protein YdhG (YjbR/CyaY superfamily)
MPSGVATVEQYIADAPPERREALTTLRALCREVLAGFDEEIAYGMPSYLRDGVVEVAFASQKRYISLYVMRPGALDAARDRLSGLSIGKSCIRYRRPDQIDPATVRVLLDATVHDTGPVC